VLYFIITTGVRTGPVRIQSTQPISLVTGPV
jgi:hypothetical protein